LPELRQLHGPGDGRERRGGVVIREGNPQPKLG
jgi:hypothetical protein